MVNIKTVIECTNDKHIHLNKYQLVSLRIKILFLNRHDMMKAVGEAKIP